MDQSNTPKVVSVDIGQENMNHYHPPFTGGMEPVINEGPITFTLNADSFTQPLSIVPARNS